MITAIGPTWGTRLNTSYPRNQNNGALWAGRGISMEIRGGVEAQWGPVSAALVPNIIFQQNLDFETIPVTRPNQSPHANPWLWSMIDRPQRFGEDPFWTPDPGQSYIRVDAAGVAAGVATENQWWGPALRYPLLMSNTAPGFPHAFLGTSGPADIGIGQLDVELMWGHLHESDHFDDDPDNDRRMISGLAFDFQPRGLPGLSLGAARSYMTVLPPGGFGPFDYLLRPYTDMQANPLSGENSIRADNQMVSLFGRWVAPTDGLEFYGEWAREDHWEDSRDLLSAPDHSQGLMIGFQKIIARESHWLRVTGEVAALGTGSTIRSGRGTLYFYTNSTVRQGYTHRGQLLGAPIGPGSDAQFFGLDLFADWGRLGAYAERVRYHNGTYYDRWAPYYGYRGHDLELTAGVRNLLFLCNVDVSWGLAYSHRWNRDFIGLDNFDWEFRTDGNVRFHLDLKWRPGSTPTEEEDEDEDPVTIRAPRR